MSRLLKLFKKKDFKKYIHRKYTLTEHTEFSSVIDCIQVKVDRRLGIVKLNRQSFYNALNMEMISLMYEVFSRWTYDPYITAIVIASSNDNFCAGMDVKRLFNEGFVSYKNNKLIINYENIHYRKEFFKLEYQLLYALKHHKKPIFAIANNICTGEGMALATCVNGFLLIDSIISVPETKIGFFPDAGMMHMLSRCEYNLGVYYALCGENMEPYDAMECGFFKNMSFNFKRSHYSKLIENCADPNVKLSDFKFLTTPFPQIYRRTQEITLNVYLREQVMDVFGHEDMETIIFLARKLANNSIIKSNFWYNTYKSLLAASPLSLKVTLRYAKMAKTMSYEEILKMDYRIARRFMLEPDFYEAVHKKLILKNKGTITPNWKYRYFDDITNEMVDEFFKPLPDEPDIELKTF